MGFLELAWKRNSVRNFKTDSIPAEKIMRLLDAARAAPSGGNCQPWQFFVIGDAALKQKIHDQSCKQDFILDAPVFIVVCVDYPRTTARYADRGRDLYCLQDTAAAVQNILLCAVDEGLACCWCGAFDEKALAEILELKSDLRPVALIPVGYAVSQPAKRSRRPVEEITTFIGFEDGIVPKK